MHVKIRDLAARKSNESKKASSTTAVKYYWRAAPEPLSSHETMATYKAQLINQYSAEALWVFTEALWEKQSEKEQVSLKVLVGS